MKVWTVERTNYKPLEPIDKTHVLRPESIGSHEAQTILNSIYQRRIWMCCFCTNPHPLMFARRTAKGAFALVNHSEHGVHDIGCPFYTEVSGKPRERQEVEAQKEERFILLRGFPIDTDEPQEQLESSVATTGKHRDSLLRLLDHLLEDTWANIHHPSAVVNPAVLMWSMRDAAVSYRAFGKPIKSIFFTGSKGVWLAKRMLAEAYSVEPEVRQSVVLLLHARYISLRDNTISITSSDGKIILLENQQKQIVVDQVVGGRKSISTPGWFIAVLAKNLVTDSHISVMRCAYQPHYQIRSPIPIEDETVAEVAEILTALIDRETQRKIWLTVPLLPRIHESSGVSYKPDLILNGKDELEETVRLAIVVLSNTNSDEFSENVITQDLDALSTIWQDSAALNLRSVKTKETLSGMVHATFRQFADTQLGAPPSGALPKTGTPTTGTT